MRTQNSLPHILPILPIKRRLPFNDPEWVFDLKYDGFRGLLYSYPMGFCRLISKQDNRLPFVDLELGLAKCLRGREAILDGEVCSLGPGGWPRFNKLMRRQGDIVYVAFDIMWLRGRDLRMAPLRERRKILRSFVKETECIKIAFSVEETGLEFFKAVLDNDLEGIVAKRLESPYTRHTHWYKIKNPNYSQNKFRHKFFVQSRSK